MTQTAHEKRQHVPGMLHLRARFFERTAPAWRQLARLESSVLRDEIEKTRIKQPIYIAGVPRAGSTILTELLSRHPDVTSHRYSDFPNVYTPFWRNWLAQRSGQQQAEMVERAHRDRIMVSTESPEAVEEVIWMQFFDQLHNPTLDQVLSEETSNPEFEHFYRDHIRKLLLARKRRRYLAKGNYNTTRIRYIRKLFPDARFIVPVRNPVNQVASLIKQDRLFQKANKDDSRVGRQLGMSGHFEFGPGRRPICVGDGEDARKIAEHWKAGHSVAGWALYWHSVYSQLLKSLSQDSVLKSAVYILRYEDLCTDPKAVIGHLLEHTRLDVDSAESLIAEYSERISEPEYYNPDFSTNELDQLLSICEPAASRLGYSDHRGS